MLIAICLILKPYKVKLIQLVLYENNKNTIFEANKHQYILQKDIARLFH